MRLCVWVSVECTCLWFSCVFESLPRWENNRQRPFHVHFLGLEHRAASLRPRCSTGKNTNSHLCGRQTFPSWCLLCFVGLRSLQASGCSFMLLCLRNHVTMYLPHTFFISTLQFICTNASRGNWRLNFWNYCTCEKKNTNCFFVLFCFLRWSGGFLFQITCFSSPSPSMII